MRILVVEDEAKVARALREGLQREQYEVSIVRTGEDGFFQMTEQEFDLVILDIMFPKRDGFEVLKALRKEGKHIPVLVLTARDTLEGRVLGSRRQKNPLAESSTATLATPPHAEPSNCAMISGSLAGD